MPSKNVTIGRFNPTDPQPLYIKIKQYILEIIERYEIEYLLKQSNQNNQPNIFNDNNNQIYNNNELTIEHINII